MPDYTLTPQQRVAVALNVDESDVETVRQLADLYEFIVPTSSLTTQGIQNLTFEFGPEPEPTPVQHGRPGRSRIIFANPRKSF